MITRLQIRNFQTHENLTIRLDTGVTTIIGPSDAGKSAILRALKWLCFNKPTGDAFIRHGSDRVAVHIKVDGHTVSRRKSADKNTYAIDGKKYVAFGTGVPDAVLKLLQLSEINFQDQHDSPFWFSLSPPEVSRQLNSIVDLGVIDSSLSAASKTLRNFRFESTLHSSKLERAKETQQELDWARDADKELASLEGQNKDLEAKVSRARRLHVLLQQDTKHRDTYRIATGKRIDGEELVSKGQEWATLENHRKELQKLVEEAARFDSTEAPDDRLLIKRERRFQNIRKSASGLRELIGDRRQIEGEQATSLREIGSLAKEIKSIRKCPLCDQPIHP